MGNIQIKDYPNLVKSNSGVILNNDISGLEAAKSRKEQKRKQQQEIEELKSKVDKIEFLLETLVHKFTDDGK
tara:strand:+ start:423 stop:638 length:216 start_codon:yes stop_codon:yes gene_type:complete